MLNFSIELKIGGDEGAEDAVELMNAIRNAGFNINVKPTRHSYNVQATRKNKPDTKRIEFMLRGGKNCSLTLVLATMCLMLHEHKYLVHPTTTDRLL